MVRRIHKTTELNIPECVWMIKSSVHNWKLFNTYTFQHGAESKQKHPCVEASWYHYLRYWLCQQRFELDTGTGSYCWNTVWTCIKQKKGLGLSFWGKIGFDELLAFLKRNASMNYSGILYLKYIEMAHNLIGSIVKNWNELRKSIVKLEL